ncbi:DEAD/DEAH box helicase family protein [Fructobacillus sp. W13]|uniref:DEAD/DEAH box helicase family protein n=1 Tax=Fructobacillus apis TaxID=2935017 RepID=A0ABT0ZRR6_9LACO|nr:DEAD/DEAH box helicase [Fructobacillus apis]MCO0832670.1 DEAD/DEAH box helicase family protein [Fructobacillus apis]
MAEWNTKEVKSENLYGRLLTWPKVWPVPKGARVLATFVKGRCFRCGEDKCSSMPGGHRYCLSCLALGRVSSRDSFVTLPEPNRFKPFSGMTWSGKLTPHQEEVGQGLVRHYKGGEDQLVWAVTGAGKTEMLFLVVDYALRHGHRVALLSPRVDVVLELAPRLKAVFPVFTQVLYGDQEEPYRYSQLVIGTTHQALRFYRAFDLVIVDEVDAFPFRDNAVLERAVSHSKKETGNVIYLTATPSKKLLSMGRHGELVVHELPARFHGQPLPEIKICYGCQRWKERPPNALIHAVKRWEKQGLPFLIFLPHVTDLSTVGEYVATLTKTTGTTVHASDEDRLLKVGRLRAGSYRYLVTTTILERGVTLPGLQVAVLGADSPDFFRQCFGTDCRSGGTQ